MTRGQVPISKQKLPQFILPFAIFLSLILVSPAVSQNDYYIAAGSSNISCEVGYAVVGKYQAVFEDFSGMLRFDEKDIARSSVALKIKTDSIKSKYRKLDRIARSDLLLDAKQYPNISFQSRSIVKKQNAYWVTGILDMHGVTKELSFPFSVEQVSSGKILAQGKWVINRKDFGVVWNQVLDKGGVVAGDNITIDWKISGVKG